MIERASKWVHKSSYSKWREREREKNMEDGAENKEFRCILRKRNSCLWTVATTVYVLLCRSLIPVRSSPTSCAPFHHSDSVSLYLPHLLCAGFCKCLSPFVHFISFRNFLLNFRFINDCTFGVKMNGTKSCFCHLYRWIVHSGLRTQTIQHTYTLMEPWFWHTMERFAYACACGWQSAYWISKLN